MSRPHSDTTERLVWILCDSDHSTLPGDGRRPSFFLEGLSPSEKLVLHHSYRTKKRSGTYFEASVPYRSQVVERHPFLWPHPFGLQVLSLCFYCPEQEWTLNPGLYPTTQEEGSDRDEICCENKDTEKTKCNLVFLPPGFLRPLLKTAPGEMGLDYTAIHWEGICEETKQQWHKEK